jgi:hypothetical protein
MWRGLSMSFLEVTFRDERLLKSKEIRILSCETICGKQIRADFERKDVQKRIQSIQNQDPNRFKIKKGQNIFKVKSSNSTDITFTSSGNCPWYLVRAHKSSRKQINFLFLNQVLWGLEISSGLRMKKSCETHGQEKIAEFITKKVNSIFDKPEEWEKIEFFCR